MNENRRLYNDHRHFFMIVDLRNILVAFTSHTLFDFFLFYIVYFFNFRFFLLKNTGCQVSRIPNLGDDSEH